MPRRPAPPPSHVRQWFAKHGQKGGETRAANMTPEERSAKASAAAHARWAKARGEQPDDSQKQATTPPPAACDTITLPPELLDRLDALQARMGLSSRQSAAEVLIRAGLNSLNG